MSPPSGLRFNLAVVSVLWRRDLKRFFRQRSRIVGALLQPLIFWFVLGSGLAGTFQMAGVPGLGYLEYFYPGIVAQIILFTSIFTTMSVIEDRGEGFLQAVLVAPAARGSLVLGKALGGTSIALLQAAAFLALAPWTGFPAGAIQWAPLFLFLLATGLCLTGLGFFMAWKLNSIQGYHAVMSVLLLPAWMLSGAMFPLPSGGGWLAAAMRANPLTYCVDGIRRSLYGRGADVPGAIAGLSTGAELAIVAVFALAALAAAARACGRRE